MSGFRRCCDGDRYPGRTLEEIAAELVGRVAESFYAPRDAAPLDSHRVDDGAENPEGMRRVEAIGDRENIEHRADVAHVQLCDPASDVHVPAIAGKFSAPEEK